jgi:hypothetical protein
MLKSLVLVTAVTASVTAMSQTCIMQQNTVSRTQATIQERSQISANVVSIGNGQKKCLVDMRVKINNNWHRAFGEHVWNGNQPSKMACARAVKQAEDLVIQQVTASDVVTENVLICNDRDNMDTLLETKNGTVGKLAQFRPHPTHTREFWHNGARCRWFLDTVWKQTDIGTLQGIICQLRDSNWVVVDKF